MSTIQGRNIAWKRTRVASGCLYLSGIFCFHFFFSSSSLFLSFRSAVKRFLKKTDENITVHILVCVPRPLKIVVMSYSPYVATTGLKGFWPFPFPFFYATRKEKHKKSLEGKIFIVRGSVWQSAPHHSNVSGMKRKSCPPCFFLLLSFIFPG